ncbi:hypothetical protein AAG570_001443 [Ranatra chinensis]|uniref:Prolactin regulatory element-binding protein n=1 Tax=Ranatra chinensis TaxID=642074 RepID=A0ABD0Y8I8_9HEMI
MAPSRRNNEGLLARVNFPLFTVQMLTSRHVVVAGGGGSSKTGVANGFEIFELSHDGKRFIAEELGRHETGPKVVMNCATHTTSKHTYLVAGQESHCQLYDVAITVVKQPPDDAKPANGKIGNNNLRRRRLSRSGSSELENKVDGNCNAVKRLQFDFKAMDSIQTDFMDVEPVQRVVRISRCGKLMATGGIDGHVRLWSFPSMRPSFDLTDHKKEIDDLDFSPDSKMAISVAKDGQAFIWCTSKGKKICTLTWTPPNGNKYLYKRCRFGSVEENKSRSRVFTICNSIGKPSGQALGYLQQWDPVHGTLERSCPVSESLSALAVRDDGTFLAIGTMFTGSVAIYIAFSLQVKTIIYKYMLMLSPGPPS